MGIQPDILVCRSEHPLTDGIKDKIALFCNVPSNHVLQNLDVEYLYEAPLAMEKETSGTGAVCECLHLECPEPDLKDWTEMVDYLKHPNTECNCCPGRQIYPASRCLYQCCRGIETRRYLQHVLRVHIKWVDSETVTTEEVRTSCFSDVDGILVPGGFGDRGIEGKIEAIRYARDHKVSRSWDCVLVCSFPS